MKVKMVPTMPVSCLCIDEVVYQPENNGDWLIDERDVELARSHSFLLTSEAAQVKPLKDQLADLKAENDRLRTQLADKNGKKPK